jgi:MFS family permease
VNPYAKGADHPVFYGNGFSEPSPPVRNLETGSLPGTHHLLIAIQLLNPSSNTLSRQNSDSLPPGFNNAFFFATFNALSFQMVLSSPMILFAKELGATATVLGIISGMTPLLVIFQIPAASHIPKFGYRKFVYSGWGIRVIFIFLMALVPLSHTFLDPSTQLALLLFLLFGFNLSRGISSCAWLPWITSLIPPSIRGRYLVRDAACVNLASFAALLLAAFSLGNQPRPWQFSFIFGFSALMGMTSLFFLKRIPEGAVPGQHRTAPVPVPWLEISRYRPFRKLLWMNVGWALSYGGLNAFTIAFLKTETAMSEAGILMAASTSFLGGFASLWFLGSGLDRFGSKPILTFSLVTWIFIIFGWTALAGGMFAPSRPLVLALLFLMGLGAALVTMANTRLAMAIIPEMGRNHFFALFSVVGSLTLGLAPILWGLLIDMAHPLQISWQGFEWNRYSLFFFLVSVMFMVSVVLCRKLEEPEAVSMENLLREIFIHSPRKVWVRFWPR